MQGGEERTRLNVEDAAGDLLDSAGDAQAVQLARSQGFQNEQIQSALQEGCRFRAQRLTPIEFRYEYALLPIECQ